MSQLGYCPSRVGLDRHGIEKPSEVHWNLPPAELYERALRAEEGQLASNGAMVCTTGTQTGRSPKDKYIVKDSTTADVVWWGPVNEPISEQQFDKLHQLITAHCRGRKLYLRDMFAGAEESNRVPIRIVTETAWHNLFAAQLFVRPPAGSTSDHDPQFTVVSVPTCLADPEQHGIRSKTFVVVNFNKGLVLIGGTGYAGEIKKSIFTIMNYVLPRSGVLSMHCSANIGARDDVALFFGLSGTGKTTLSADPERRLIGDDEHGWSDRGVFNIEGGCYAKCIRLSEEAEPQIYRAIRFGSVLENVVLHPETRTPDYDADELTENTRAAYPVEHIPNVAMPSVGGHPRNVVFLTCDAFGVLPPVSRLSAQQAMYHFLSGYTAKVAGTERGVTEPQATFSACFGAPFLPLAPEKYATMLGDRVDKHDAKCWLINTGWSGGPYGVGARIKLRYTRAMVKAALSGRLDEASFAADPIFGVQVPKSCPDVPSEVLAPRATWKDPEAFDAKAKELAGLFVNNFAHFDRVPAEVKNAGPKV